MTLCYCVYLCYIIVSINIAMRDSRQSQKKLQENDMDEDKLSKTGSSTFPGEGKNSGKSNIFHPLYIYMIYIFSMQRYLKWNILIYTVFHIKIYSWFWFTTKGESKGVAMIPPGSENYLPEEPSRSGENEPKTKTKKQSKRHRKKVNHQKRVNQQ